MGKRKLDKIDITILRHLQKDARTKYSDIAKECDVSVDTIIKRFRKLRDNGIVTGTTLLLDPREFGEDVIANLSIDVEPSNVEEVLDFMRRQEGVNFATHAMGEYDIFSIVTRRSMNDMNALKETIQSHRMVREIKTSIWVDQFLLCPQNFELESR
jgi:Lrp/AsnC family transcriptional regulator for asnA, asnC and gidA